MKIEALAAVLRLLLRTVLLLSFSFSLALSAWAREPVLNEVLARSKNLAALGGQPVVVMDLDETVVDSTSRRFQSYQEAVSLICGELRTESCGKAAGLNLMEFFALPNRYDQRPLFDQVGIESGPWRETLVNTMFAVYLSGKWMELDQAVPGAVEYIQDIRETGAKIFFVSSRWKSRQGSGTFASLKRLGMIADQDRDFVILRPDGMSSIDFKRKTFEQIRSWLTRHGAEIVGAFENEPENMNAMVLQFPNAIHVFIQGAWLKHEELLGSPAIITRYR